jgi:putative membrane protein
MKTDSKVTWTSAFKKSPGPNSVKAAGILFIKGICMGSADVIPGVSGGTIALITGIYEQLLDAIKSFNGAVVKKIMAFDIKGALGETHSRFLIVLFAGISLAIVSIARVMHYLLLHHPILTWSLFFGLIAASIMVVGKKVSSWRYRPGLSFFAGLTAAWLIVGLIPVETPEAFWFIFISGFIAICAMILPGLSGAFLLLILGKYEFITGALKNPFVWENAIIIIVFCSGTVLGLLCFARVLKFFLDTWHDLSMAFLTGLMAGSMRKIWPWKEQLESTVIRGKVHVLREQNVLPNDFSPEVGAALGLAVLGFVIVVLLEKLSTEK